MMGTRVFYVNIITVIKSLSEEFELVDFGVNTRRCKLDCNTYALLTKLVRSRWLSGYWPSSFFAFLWTETKSRSIKTQKRTRPISSHLY